MLREDVGEQPTCRQKKAHFQLEALANLSLLSWARGLSWNFIQILWYTQPLWFNQRQGFALVFPNPPGFDRAKKTTAGCRRLECTQRIISSRVNSTSTHQRLTYPLLISRSTACCLPSC